MSTPAVTESDLNAYVDGVLPEARRAELEAYLAGHPEATQRVADYRKQISALHALYDPVLNEAVPARLLSPRKRWLGSPSRYAAIMAWVALGGVAGWYAHEFNSAKSADSAAFARQAAIAHVVYSPEVRHPVEVGADQEAHLVAWLSKRLGASLKIPQLNGLGYQLVGGRLLPGNQGPVAQFMFQDVIGQRLTLYVRTAARDSRETAFRFTQERGVSVFYWIDGKFGYALSGETGKAELLRIAQSVYQQLNP